MKKRTLLTAALGIGLISSALSGTANAAAMNVSVNGTPVKFNTSPIVRANTTMVQVAPIFRSLEINFSWDQTKQQLTATKNGSKIVMTIGSKNVYVNGSRITMQQAPISVNGNIFVPLRFISEVTGATVNAYGNDINIYNPSSSGTNATYTPAPSVSTGSASSSNSVSVDSIAEYLNNKYGKISTLYHDYNVQYLVNKDGEEYSISILFDNLESMSKLLDDADDVYAIERLTHDFNDDLHRKFGLDDMRSYVYLAVELPFYPKSSSYYSSVTSLSNGNYMLTVPEFLAHYDYAAGEASFYLITVDGDLFPMLTIDI